MPNVNPSPTFLRAPTPKPKQTPPRHSSHRSHSTYPFRHDLYQNRGPLGAVHLAVQIDWIPLHRAFHGFLVVELGQCPVERLVLANRRIPDRILGQLALQRKGRIRERFLRIETERFARDL